MQNQCMSCGKFIVSNRDLCHKCYDKCDCIPCPVCGNEIDLMDYVCESCGEERPSEKDIEIFFGTGKWQC